MFAVLLNLMSFECIFPSFVCLIEFLYNFCNLREVCIWFPGGLIDGISLPFHQILYLFCLEPMLLVFGLILVLIIFST